MVAVELEGDWLVELQGGKGTEGRPWIGLGFLSSKTASHAGAFDGDAMAGTAENFGDNRLSLGRVLGGRVNEDRLFAIRLGEGSVGFEVELLLATDVDGAGELMRTVLETLVDIASSENVRVGVE